MFLIEVEGFVSLEDGVKLKHAARRGEKPRRCQGNDAKLRITSCALESSTHEQRDKQGYRHLMTYAHLQYSTQRNGKQLIHS